MADANQQPPEQLVADLELLKRQLAEIAAKGNQPGPDADGEPERAKDPAMPNQIMVIAPYWINELGAWVFDDPKAGLEQEPFVSGVPEMIDFLVKNIPNAKDGFRMLFSAAPFPGYQRKLAWRREEMGGNWYASDDPPMEGWLCPALFRYFDQAPKELYVKAEAKK